MGPFVPDPISDQLNLVVALLLGIGFGVVLEQAGFSSSRRLAGVFYGYDFTVLRVFFTAAVTAMSGVLLLGYFGLLDTDAIFVNPTWLFPAIVGGIIMGFGFVVGGYCPGTSLCAAAIGKIDAMFFVGGGLLGVLFFGELYPFYEHFYESTSLGPIKVYDSLNIAQGTFAFLLIAIALGAFAVTTILEKRVNKTQAPSLSFNHRRHILAGLAVLVLGIFLLILPDRKTHLINLVSSPNYELVHPVKLMDADELAFRIVDHDTKMQVVDARPVDAYTQCPLPGSVNVQLRDLFSKDLVSVLGRRNVKKVILGNNENDERPAALLMSELGYENVVILRGGFDEFNSAILNPSQFIETGSRWDADVSRFRRQARLELMKMIADSKNKGPKEVKKQKKIQGGC
ncbi:MAG: YeeE/YedE thiosulfate transporter family protein [Bacteroidota bacterium]|jgi:rhodanese-related sulfurtransferase/uncharacterized membrane protein YedE/YeeE